MKKNLTELVFILDRSGSMRGLESDTVGGYNALLDKQRKEDGEAIVTTVLFDDGYELLHDRIPLTGIADITTKEYYVRGCTALLDAVGRTITKVENAQAHTLESQRPEKTLFVITTDGLENASKEYRLDTVKAAGKEAGSSSSWGPIWMRSRPPVPWALPRNAASTTMRMRQELRQPSPA